MQRPIFIKKKYMSYTKNDLPTIIKGTWRSRGTNT